jgi:signal transduction histidine kinase
VNRISIRGGDPLVCDQQRRNQGAGKRESGRDKHHDAEPCHEGLLYGALDLHRRPWLHALRCLSRPQVRLSRFHLAVNLAREVHVTQTGVQIRGESSVDEHAEQCYRQPEWPESDSHPHSRPLPQRPSRRAARLLPACVVGDGLHRAAPLQGQDPWRYRLGLFPRPGEEEKVFLGAVADQAAVAVENARLFSDTRGKAALEERQRLARELHDSVSQALYGIALGVETARELLPYDPERASGPLDYAVTLAEAGMTEIRALIFELCPESLEKEGLVAALEKQAAAIQARHGIRVETAFGEEPDAPLEAKESLYHIAQEALHNTVKHARAVNVKIQLGRDFEGITLEISDDGVGFDARDDFPGHLGLNSMRERAWRQGGTLEIVSAPGKGANIFALVPFGSS